MLEELQSTLKDYIQAGQVLSYLAAFVSGFLLSFTPCIYPLAVGLLCIFLGLFSMDIIKINLPAFLSSSKVNIKKRQPNLFFSFIIGITIGLVVGPCTAPALSAILMIVAEKQNLFLGSA